MPSKLDTKPLVVPARESLCLQGFHCVLPMSTLRWTIRSGRRGKMKKAGKPATWTPESLK